MANLHRCKNQKVRADSLLIHPYAQRELSKSRVKKLREKLDLDAIGTIHAVEYAPKDYKSGLYVVDGQHRIRALVEEGMGEWEVLVSIHVDVKNDERASELFLNLQDRLAVSSADKFINELQAKDDIVVGIDDILRQQGVKFSKASGDGSVACPISLKRSYKLDDGKALHRGMGWITHAWGKRSEGLEGKIIEGLSLVASANNGNIDDAAMVIRLAKYAGGPSALLGDAKGRVRYHRGSLARAVASTIIDSYNSGRKTGRLAPI